MDARPSGSQNVVPRPAESISLGDLSDMQILNLLNQELRLGPTTMV